MSLVHQHDLADVTVLNFGLHAGDQAVYARAMRHALEELEAFGRSQPGVRVSILRETSAQHFPAPSGDYHAAISRDPALVLADATRREARQWNGPSMCTPITADAPPHWRNAVVRDLLLAQPPAPGRYPHVRLQPFEQLTRRRWDFHSSTKWSGGQWRSDCTHFCYSHCFWSQSFVDLHRALGQHHSHGGAAAGGGGGGRAGTARRGGGMLR